MELLNYCWIVLLFIAVVLIVDEMVEPEMRVDWFGVILNLLPWIALIIYKLVN